MWCKLSNLTCWTPAAVRIFPARAYCTARTPLARSLKLDTRCRSMPRVALGELLLGLRRGLSFPAGFLSRDVLPFTFRDGKAKCSLSGNRTIKSLLVSRQMLKRRGGVVPFPSVAVRQWGELCSWAALMFWVHEYSSAGELYPGRTTPCWPLLWQVPVALGKAKQTLSEKRGRLWFPCPTARQASERALEWRDTLWRCTHRARLQPRLRSSWSIAAAS